MKKLTEAQQAFAAEHHDLIYGFLRKHRLDPEEWYGIAAEGFVRAAAIYDPARGAFSTLAYKSMWMMVQREFWIRKRPKRNVVTISLEEEQRENGLTLQDRLAAPDDPESEAILSADLEQALDALTQEQRRMLSLRMAGVSYLAIGEQTGLSRQGALNRINAVREILWNYLSTERKCGMAQWYWSQKRKQEYMQMAQEGKSPEEIAAALGCDAETVTQYAEKRRSREVERQAAVVIPESRQELAPAKAAVPDPLLHILIRDAQGLCQEVWEGYTEMDHTGFVYLLGRLQDKLDIATGLLDA